VLPNRNVDGDIEGFGMVLLEAQACGRPVIAGNSGGTTETMRVGSTGLILNCESPVELERVIPELLLDPARLSSMGRAGRHWTETHFAWPALTLAAAELLESRESSNSKRYVAKQANPIVDDRSSYAESVAHPK